MRRLTGLVGSLALMAAAAAGCGWFGPKAAGPVKADYDKQTGRLKTLTRDSTGGILVLAGVGVGVTAGVVAATNNASPSR